MTDHDQPAPPPPPPPPPPPMAAPFGAPAPAPAPKARNTGLLVGLGIVLVGVIVGVVIFVSGGDDKSSSSGRSGDGAQTPAPTVLPDTTGAPDTTVVESTEAPDTTAAADEPLERITDDTGTFTIPLPGEYPYTTQSFEDNNGLTVASIIVAEDLEAYGTTLEGNGFTILAVPATSYTANEMMNELTNGASCLASAYYERQVATQWGSAFVSRFDDCGDTGTAAQVVLSIEDPASGLVFGVYVQGIGSSLDDLLPLAEAMINTIRLV